MATVLEKEKLVCAHCGLPARPEIEENGNYFCCHGCKTAHSFLQSEPSCELPEPAAPRSATELAWLDTPGVLDKWKVRSRGDAITIRLKLPGIHCASCVQVLERLYIRKEGILQSQVQFLRKEIEITFIPDVLPFSGLVSWLDSLGYRPELSDPSADQQSRKRLSESTLLTMRMAVAGFCAGNIMLLSFPEYLGLQDDSYRHFFGWLNLALALPAFIFSGWGYLKAVWLGITQRILNLDVPIGVAMLATLSLSLYEIITQTGAGYFDSLIGLIFFLLIGRWVQNRTFEFLSFERDFRSYFPLSITRMDQGKEQSILSSDIKAGDILKIHHGEIIPCDGSLLEGEALVDYSFVTGESRPEEISAQGDLLAGGRQTSGSFLMKANQEMSRSQLVTLWNNPIFRKDAKPGLKTFADQVAYYFTPAVMLLAIGVAITWLFFDPSVSLRAFVSILIVACPCTLQLAYPMALSNTMRLFGKEGFFLKNTEVVESLALTDTLVFDKTGTLSDRLGVQVTYTGMELSDREKTALASILAGSTHPLSRAVLGNLEKFRLRDGIRMFREEKGMGVKGLWEDVQVEAGSARFVMHQPGPEAEAEGSLIYVRINEAFKGYFNVRSAPLPFVSNMIHKLGRLYRMHMLSGDHAKGQSYWESLFRKYDGTARFAQSPEDKLTCISSLQYEGHTVAMVGDGLNDAGALRKSDVGIAIASDAHQFTPGSDAILLAGKLAQLPGYLKMSRLTMQVVRFCFWVSLVYNTVGLSFAVFGKLEPVVAAILMPVSSISVVLIAWIGTEINRKWIRKA